MSMSTQTPHSSLDAFFHPRSIAVVGASRHLGTISGDLFHNLVSRALTVPVYPVNRSAGAVQSVQAFARISDVPSPVDLAIIAAPAAGILPIIDDCAAAGVKAVVVLSAGFREVGPEGRRREDELLQRVRAHGMRLIGPNCLGILGTDPALELNATFGAGWPPPGNVAFGSQSGALGLAVLDYAQALGIGISQFVSLGNKADVSGNDLLEHWEHDARTQVILLYLESFGNPMRFMEIARRVTRHKPIVVVKSGRTKVGARAAASHTGALASADVAVDALFAQTGVIRTDTLEQLFDVARLLADQPVPAGARVAILTNGGGLGIMSADACETSGLQVPEPGAATVAGLRAFLPAEASLKNPVDMIASASADSYQRALALLLDDPGIDAVLVLFVHPMVTSATAVAHAITQAARANRKPVLACLLGTRDVPAAVEVLKAAHIPAYAFPEAAVFALARAARYGQWLAQPEEGPPPVTPVPAGAAAIMTTARGAAPPSGWLAQDTVHALLSAYGFRVVRTQTAGDRESAVAAARAIGFPVAVKLASSTITHKTDVGGVVLGVSSEDEVRATWDGMKARLAEQQRDHEMSGVTVQEMVTGGQEMFLGATEGGDLGRLIAFGMGGIHVEVLGDVAFGVPPLTPRQAEQMLDRLRAAPLIAGHRGAPGADREALVASIGALDRLVRDFPGIATIDINPLVAFAPGQGVLVLDARIRLAEEKPIAVS